MMPVQPERRGPPGTAAGSDEPFRYQEIAAYVAALVEAGTLRPGMRAPSIREIALRKGTAISTAIQAYRLLEDRGVLEAPGMSKPPGRPTGVAVTSRILELLEYAARPEFVPLGCAVPSPELLAVGRLDRFMARAARVRGAHFNTYTEPRGNADLRNEICRRALRWGQALSPDNIAITCGCTEALSSALRAVTSRGDTVAIESPTYFGLLQVCEALELKVLELPTDAREGLDIAALEKALKADAIKACLLSSSFNNPLGCLMSDDKKLAIVELLGRHGVPLIEDDIYGDIYFGAERPKPFMALAPHADIIYCSSFSKTLAPGYRVGWIATARHMERVLETKFALTLCGPALPQAALAEYLSSGGYDGHLRRIRGVFADNIDRMTQAINRSLPVGTRVTRPAGGFVLWLELPGEFDSRRLFQAAIAQGICYAPGPLFTASARHRNCMRLSCGHPWGKRIEASVTRLGEMAAEALAGGSGVERLIR